MPPAPTPPVRYAPVEGTTSVAIPAEGGVTFPAIVAPAPNTTVAPSWSVTAFASVTPGASSSVAPEETVTAPVPIWSAAVTRSVPAETVVVPVYAFVKPVFDAPSPSWRISVPAPAFVSLPEPETAAPRVTVWPVPASSSVLIASVPAMTRPFAELAVWANAGRMAKSSAAWNVAPLRKLSPLPDAAKVMPPAPRTRRLTARSTPPEPPTVMPGAETSTSGPVEKNSAAVPAGAKARAQPNAAESERE